MSFTYNLKTGYLQTTFPLLLRMRYYAKYHTVPNIAFSCHLFSVFDSYAPISVRCTQVLAKAPERLDAPASQPGSIHRHCYDNVYTYYFICKESLVCFRL